MVSDIGSRLSDVESMVAGFQNNMEGMNKNIANLFKVVYIWSKILLDHVSYLKLRIRYVRLLQAEQLTKWQLFSIKMTMFFSPRTILSKSSCRFVSCSACNNRIFFLAWDKSRDPAEYTPNIDHLKQICNILVHAFHIVLKTSNHTGA